VELETENPSRPLRFRFAYGLFGFMLIGNLMVWMPLLLFVAEFVITQIMGFYLLDSYQRALANVAFMSAWAGALLGLFIAVYAALSLLRVVYGPGELQGVPVSALTLVGGLLMGMPCCLFSGLAAGVSFDLLYL
jgi:hypothetical protein